VSSIRVFILGSLAERGPMHGHALRLLAEEEHIDEWADFAVGAIYGAIKRLAADGLIESLRTERFGNYPERQVYSITTAGQQELDELRQSVLNAIVLRPDPVDLVLARLDVDRVEDLGEILAARAAELRARIESHETHLARIAIHLTLMERHIIAHQTFRLRGELAWHESMLDVLPELIDDEKSRKGHHS
jgi:DNA-binding PadR family transcriptional regulator